jgi:glutamyl-tRNA reductase
MKHREDHIFIAGLNHRTAGVEIRETFALNDCNVCEGGLLTPEDGVSEAVVLSTCNRVEIITVVEGPDAEEAVARYWAGHCKGEVETLKSHIYTYRGLEAVEHLFSVAAGLDSMVMGEPQILGQLKDAYRTAVDVGSAKVVLNNLMHKSFSTAKRVRSETGIGSAAVSISYAAVELAKKIFDDLSKNKAMLIGAGEMAELAAMHLMGAGLKELIVVNRTFERAQDLAERFSGRAAPIDLMGELMPEVDIIISSTGSPRPIIAAADVKPVLKKRRNKPMFFFDIAVPRDIDPDVNGLDNVYLYDIDDLKEVVEENLEKRREEAEKAKAVVHDEALRFGRWLESLDLKPTIVDLLNKGDKIAEAELLRTFRRLGHHTDPQTLLAVETLAYSLVKKLYHEPIVYLKRRAMEEGTSDKVIDMTRKIFNLDEKSVPEDAHADRKAPSEHEDDDADDTPLPPSQERSPL